MPSLISVWLPSVKLLLLWIKIETSEIEFLMPPPKIMEKKYENNAQGQRWRSNVTEIESLLRAPQHILHQFPSSSYSVTVQTQRRRNTEADNLDTLLSSTAIGQSKYRTEIHIKKIYKMRSKIKVTANSFKRYIMTYV